MPICDSDLADHDGSARELTVVDLFAGAGGFTAGLTKSYRPEGAEHSPFRSIAAVEHDPAAAATYAANFGGHVDNVDITGWLPPQEVLSADVIVGGPPCQGFSGLGKEDPDDPRNLLWKEYVRVVGLVRPKIFIIENVDRFMRSPQFADLQRALDDDRLGDYEIVPAVLNAADYGVPQARRRTIVIGTRKDVIRRHPGKRPLSHPPATHVREPDLTGRPLWRTVQEAVFDHVAKTVDGIDLPDRAAADGGVPGPYRTTELHIGREPRPLSIARYAAIPAGGNRKNLRNKTAVIDGEEIPLSTESWDRHNNGSGDVMGRLHADRPSVTIRTEFYKPEKGRYLHPVADRPITHYEAALIQGFPRDFVWHGSKIQIARQIGNAVPVGLGSAIGKAIDEYLRKLGPEEA
ncbi:MULTISPECIES: DNA cytosine methyltransferase [Streptomycetaceae]|uniref:DNA cytosine methyltransferase n=1 Tax=Streptomycetaceae TaxID=2062 RepID=UPI000938CC2F|nr:DNA cytosine methyltransferase [Streptomyces sp. CB02056]OKI11193.1 cytosine methyltransferase [Streptomyces sp. CB02056]